MDTPRPILLPIRKFLHFKLNSIYDGSQPEPPRYLVDEMIVIISDLLTSIGELELSFQDFMEYIEHNQWHCQWQRCFTGIIDWL